MPQTPQNPRRYSIDGREFEAEKLKPGLYVTATPIGNLADITLRALKVLAGAGAVLCEDTRVTSKLLARYGIRARLEAYHDFNAAKLRPRLVEDIRAGASFALVSDAGMPLVSDPGQKLVMAVAEEGLHVETVPGPSAALAGFALSGIPSDRFLFAGFFPEKQGERRRVLEEFRSVRAALIFFESPNRIIDALETIAEAAPGRRVAVAREITKLHEEVLRGSAGEIAAALAAREAVKGEITLVLGPPPEEIMSGAEIDARLIAAAEALPASAAAARVAKETSKPKSELYARLMALKGNG